MLGEFEIVRRIGAGGMAEVFLAEKRGAEGTSKRIVIKRILPGQQRDARLYAMFVREARLATGLDHPNIVQVHELVDHARDGLLLAMEYVDGADLARVLRMAKQRGEPVSPYVAALIAREAAKGLHYAHEHADAEGAPLEIVHRDVSPQNILVSRHGAVKIADLGIATARLYRDVTTGVKGKYRYMPPEQVAGVPLDRRADIYALGVVLYEMLRLESPYGARANEALLRAVRTGRFDPPLATITDVPADLLAIVRRALAPDREARYPTARELADDLSRTIVAQGRLIDETAIESLVRPVLDEPPEPVVPSDAATVVSMRESATPSQRLAAGVAVGRYRITSHLGHGGMGDVYAARHTTLDREVALKILHGATSAEARGLLLREAKLAAHFEHAGSVVIYDVGEASGVGFIAMEIVRGAPLADFIGDRDVPLGRRVRWLVGAARVLAAAHAAGLVHMDVKPNNLMIREGGEVKVLDFGIARAFAAPLVGVGEASTASGSFLGTLRYVAPERLAGEPVDGRTDQFSWGVTAWELLAGWHPLDVADPSDAAGKGLVDGIAPLADVAPDVPAEIARVVDRALAKRPDDRFATLDEAADALEPFAEIVTSRSGRGSLVDAAEIVESPRPPAATASVAAPKRSRWQRIARAFVRLVMIVGVFGLIASLRASRLTAPTVASSVAAPVAPVIDAFGCSDAIIAGEGNADLARAIGMAACARLSPELGVDWAAAAATHRLEVRADFQPGRVVVTLRLAGQEATGAAAMPIPAVTSAIAALVPQLRTAPWTPERVRLWGARDEASGRRIWRVWRRMATSISPNLAGEITQLLQSDGDSPMPHMLALISSAGGSEVLDAAPARILERLDRVPPARADALRAILFAFPAERDRKAAARLFRQAYSAAPDDHCMTAFYASFAARMALPEAHAVLERLHQQAPTYAIGPMTNAITRAAYRDDARNAQYFVWIGELFPEAVGARASVQHLISVGQFAEARAAIAITQRLGLEGAAGDPSLHASALAQIEIAALAPVIARDHTAVLLADPRSSVAALGGHALVASYLEEGRFAAATTALRQNADRSDDQGDAVGAVVSSLAALRLARWLDRPFDPVHATRLAHDVAERSDLPPITRLEAQAELGLSRLRHAGAEDALRAVEVVATQEANGDVLVRDRALVLGLALTRALRGDRAAAAVWERTTHAPDAARRSASLDAALALEAIADAKGAEAAYLLAADASNGMEYTGQRMIAIARLALFYRKRGRAAEAAEREAILERLWSHADPGLRDSMKRLR
jgi:serine/threonine protein kinase